MVNLLLSYGTSHAWAVDVRTATCILRLFFAFETDLLNLYRSISVYVPAERKLKVWSLIGDFLKFTNQRPLN